MGRASRPANNRHSPIRTPARRRAPSGAKIHASARLSARPAALPAGIGQHSMGWGGALADPWQRPPRDPVDPQRHDGRAYAAHLREPRLARRSLRRRRELREAGHDEAEPLIRAWELGEPEMRLGTLRVHRVGDPERARLAAQPAEQPEGRERPRLEAEGPTDQEDEEEAPDQPTSRRSNRVHVMARWSAQLTGPLALTRWV